MYTEYPDWYRLMAAYIAGEQAAIRRITTEAETNTAFATWMLEYAIREQVPELIEVALSYNADPYSIVVANMDSLGYCSLNDSYNELSVLLQSLPKSNRYQDSIVAAFREAAIYASLGCLHVLLDIGLDPHTKVDTKLGDTVFHRFSYNGSGHGARKRSRQPDVLKCFMGFLHAGGRVSECDECGETVIHYIARGNGWFLLDSAIEGMESIDPKDNQGRSPLHHACMHRANVSISTLVALGASSSLQDHSGMTPLMDFCLTCDAFSQQAVTAIDDLTRESGSIDIVDHLGYTALHHAALNGYENIDLIEWLIRHGADCNRRNLRGELPSDIASEVGNLLAAKLLCSR